MKHLTKGQLAARKKRRENHRPLRMAWKRYFQAVIRTYNQGGDYEHYAYPPLKGG